MNGGDTGSLWRATMMYNAIIPVGTSESRSNT